MKTFFLTRIFLILIIQVPFTTITRAQTSIHVHYLGHAAFIMDFNDFTVLTDFGTSNCWGYNSPIYGIGDHIPAILTISHYHEDHYDPDRLPNGIPMILDETDSLSIMQLQISPVRTCETTPGVESNTSFIFDYDGFRICHLGDAQADIMNIEDPAQQAIILEKFPEQIDLLFMTIEGVYPFIPEAELFINLLQPGMVVPIHYWSPEYKEDFLSYLELQNDTAGRDYVIIRLEEPSLELMVDDTIHNNIRVFGLTPMPYGETNINGNNSFPGEMFIYPNPSSGLVNINICSAAQRDLSIEVCSLDGTSVMPTRDLLLQQGKLELALELGHIAPGIYIIHIQFNDQRICKKLIITP